MTYVKEQIINSIRILSNRDISGFSLLWNAGFIAFLVHID